MGGNTMIETRRARRLHCDEIVDCESQGRVQSVLVRDISWGGARLRGQRLPNPGTILRISAVLGIAREWIFAQVCWVNHERNEAGIRFLEPISRIRQTWVSDLVEAPLGPERRRDIRVPTEVYMEIKLPGRSRPWEARSLDLSRGGAQLRLPESAARKGDYADVYLCLPWCMLELAAQVVRGPEAGQPSVRFFGLTPGEDEALTQFVNHQIGQN